MIPRQFKSALAILIAVGLTGQVVVLGQGANAGPGLKVGAEAPAFSLKDQGGKTHTPESLLKSKDHLALVFYRSADW